MKTDDKPLVAGFRSFTAWSILIVASVAIVVGAGDATEDVMFAAICSPVCLLILWIQVRSFRVKVPSLLAEGNYLEPYDYGSQARKGTFIILGVLAFLVLPLALAGLLDARTWIGAVLGGIDGWLLSLAGYNLLLRSWESAHDGKLYQSLVWRGTKVTHRGLTFRKAGGQAESG